MRGRTRLLAVAIAVGLIVVVWWAWPRRDREQGVAQSRSDTNSSVPSASGVPALTELLARGPDNAVLAPDVRKARLRGLFDVFRAVSREVPRDTFDAKAALDLAGREPAKLHAWVRTHTLWIPYRGVLRGAAGTLMDRRANSLDRSLLLARLITAAGGSARLARASLSHDEAVQLHQQAPPTSPASSDAAAAAALASALETYAKQAGIDPAAIRADLQKADAQGQQTAETLKLRVARQTARLIDGLGLESAATSPESADAEQETLRDHWWVQARIGQAWLDLDPALAAAGASVGNAQATFDPAALPADLHHSVQVRVIVEQWDGTALKEHRPVSIDVRPSEVVGESLRLQHIPLAWPRDLDSSLATDRERQTMDAALAQKEWLPVFVLGSRRVSQSSVRDTGELNARPGQRLLRPPAGFADALGGGEPAAPTVFTAEWIEYELRVPGRVARVIRREVFDLFGGASRHAGRAPAAFTEPQRLTRALSLVSESEILILASQPSPAFVTHLIASRVLQNEPLLTELVASDPPKGGQAALFDRVRDVRPMPGPVHAFAVARETWHRAPGTSELRQPNIVSQHTFLRQDADGRLVIAAALDIVANEIGSPGTPAEQFRARVEQGVLDANSEATLIGEATKASVTNDLSDAAGVAQPWVAIRDGRGLDARAPTPDLRARLEADLSAGFILLVPPASDKTPAVWWRVDPRTGDTLRFGDRGWGQALGEYEFVVALVGGGTLLCSAMFMGALGAGPSAIAFCFGASTLGGGLVLIGVGTAGVGWALWAIGLAVAVLGLDSMFSIR